MVIERASAHARVDLGQSRHGRAIEGTIPYGECLVEGAQPRTERRGRGSWVSLPLRRDGVLGVDSVGHEPRSLDVGPTLEHSWYRCERAGPRESLELARDVTPGRRGNPLHVARRRTLVEPYCQPADLVDPNHLVGPRTDQFTQRRR